VRRRRAQVSADQRDSQHDLEGEQEQGHSTGAPPPNEQGSGERNEHTRSIVHEEDAVHSRPLRGRATRVRSEAAPLEQFLAFAESLARVSAGGGGVSGIATQLATLLDAAVLVEDTDWRHIALAGSADRPITPSIRELLPTDATGNDVALSPPADERSRAYPIRVGETRIGWLAIFPRAETLAAALPVIRLAAASLAVEMSRETGGSRNRRRSFWDRLLSRAYDDPVQAREDAAARGVTLASHYVAVAIEGEGLDESVAAAKASEIRRVCVELLATRSAELAVIERGGGFVVLVPAPLEVDAANARTAATLIPKSLARARIEARVVGGVGRHCEMLDVARSVEDARAALVIARRIFGGGRVMPFEDLGMYPLLLRGGGTREELHAFGARVLEPLRIYDEKHQTELVRTLRLFFEVGQNIKVAAATLNVHRHTVFYRLRQIAEIASVDLDSPHDQLTLRAAIALDALG